MTELAALEQQDKEARERALEPGVSFIVRAPAGAGKTELLTQRYLALLAAVARPEEVLAITFTVKAAAEMRQRILNALAAANGPAPAAEHERRTWQLAVAAREHMVERSWDIDDHPARLRIETIDALCMSLARQMPVLSRFGAAPAISEDPQPLYRNAANAVLGALEENSRVTGNLETLLLHLDNDYTIACDLIATMLATRDRWLRHVADREQPAIQRPELESALAALVTDELAQLAARAPAALAGTLPALAAQAAANLRLEREDSPIRACQDMDAMPGASIEESDRWRGVADLLLTRNGKPRARLTTKEGFPAPSSARNPEEKEARSAAKAAMATLLESLEEHEEFVQRLDACRHLPPVRYTHVQWSVFQSLVSVLPRAVACLKLEFERARMVDFVEVAHAALRALGEPDNPTDLALSLDYRISHLLVDEFQDTSYSQFALLQRLTAGWTPDDGRSLFLVGDPMQSIYRFREAEVGLFLRAQRDGIGPLKPETLVLTRNFRSQAGLVEWVNRDFSALFPEHEDAGSSAVTFETVTATRTALDGTAVRIHPQIGADPVAEAEQVVALVEESLLENPGGSVAILVRARTHLAEILPRIRARGLRVRALDIEPLSSVPVVRDLHALTRALLHLGDRVAWLAVLRAPWCGFTLADLYALAGAARDNTIWELIIDESRRGRLSEDGRKRLSRLKRVLADSLGQRGRMPLRRWVEGTWTALGGPVCVADDQELKAARRFLGMLESLPAGGADAQLRDLERAVSRLYADPDPLADETLQIMTLHKAKGLEFDTVIVPGLGRPPGRNSDPLLMMLERLDRTGDSRLLVAPIHARGKRDAIYDYLRKVEAASDRTEQTRLLYVAVTRARKRLHLLGHCLGAEASGAARAPAGESLLARLWPVISAAFRGAQEAGIALDAEPEKTRGLRAPQRFLRRLSSDWVLPPAPQPRSFKIALPLREKGEKPDFLWVGDTARQVGVAVHAALQQIGTEGLERWDEARLENLDVHMAQVLNELGVPDAQMAEALERACLAVRNTLADKKGRWILDDQHLEARSEIAISTWIDERMVEIVIDRSFVDQDDVRWIVDFKTGSHEGGSIDEFLAAEVERYRGQLENYARVMQRMDTRSVRVGLYFPMLQEWRDWQP